MVVMSIARTLLQLLVLLVTSTSTSTSATAATAATSRRTTHYNYDNMNISKTPVAGHCIRAAENSGLPN